MTTINISGLTGAALDWAVAKCEGVKYTGTQWIGGDYNGYSVPFTRYYSTDWARGGPIIECMRISLRWDDETLYGQPQNRWLAEHPDLGYAVAGPTPLIAAMRCYVASKLGDEVDVPEGLL